MADSAFVNWFEQRRHMRILGLIILVIAAAAVYIVLLTRPPSSATLQGAPSEQTVSGKRQARSIRCRHPVGFSIGTVDPQFSVSPDELLAVALSAAEEWKMGSDVEWFRKTDEGPLKINLLFDGRQADYNLALDAQEALKDELNELSLESAELRTELAALIPILQSPLEQLREGATVRLALLKEQQSSISERASDLAVKREGISQTLSRYSEPFPAGELQRQAGIRSINIFFFRDREDLRATLLHEFGHAIGLGHLDQEESIMHPLRRPSNGGASSLSDSDIQALLSLCGPLGR